MKKIMWITVVAVMVSFSVPAATCSVTNGDGAASVSVYAAAKSGWVKSGKVWKYYQNGKAAAGWKKVSGTWYYLDKKTGAMLTGWKKLGGKWYYFGSNGKMRTGWSSDGKKYYYFNGSGVWQKPGGATDTPLEKILTGNFSGAAGTYVNPVTGKKIVVYSDGSVKFNDRLLPVCNPPVIRNADDDGSSGVFYYWNTGKLPYNVWPLRLHPVGSPIGPARFVDQALAFDSSTTRIVFSGGGEMRTEDVYVRQ